ncbi:hypothetical protein HER10_EVM0012411 [Colletotrichum scovillei]|uniref:uncharacterized protein n=1 Tax=Colletotrichum scovillei TaxID=1209932 RepID=UPI0015C3A2C3|nr:uncharacterized protein HER10_EVM0012411 [Colletotrichum scovillei]KAF4772835.1 hypothetical protein HER10_EVM0012411 [Colletotrichum scovillei]
MSAATLLAEFRRLCVLHQAAPGRAKIPEKWDALCRQWWSETRDADEAENEEADWSRLIQEAIPPEQLDQALALIYEPDIDEVTGDALIRLNRACLSLGLTKPTFFLVFGANIAKSTQSLKYLSGLCNPRSAPGSGHSPHAVIAAVRLAMTLRHKSARAFPVPVVRDVTTARKSLQAAAAAVPAAALAEENVEEPRAVFSEEARDNISAEALQPFPFPNPFDASPIRSPRIRSPLILPIRSPRIRSPLIHSPQFNWPENDLLSELAEDTAALNLGAPENEDEEMEDAATGLPETEEEEEEEDLTDHWVRLCRELSDLPIPNWAKGSTNMTFQGCRVLATAVVTRVLEIEAAEKDMAREERAAPQQQQHQHQNHRR